MTTDLIYTDVRMEMSKSRDSEEWIYVDTETAFLDLMNCGKHHDYGMVVYALFQGSLLKGETLYYRLNRDQLYSFMRQSSHMLQSKKA